MQNGSHQQLSQVSDLEKELARLRQDGQAHRDELAKQLEAAKQAATQARHDAAQAHAKASHEAHVAQQLQNDRARLVEDANVWRKQVQENQVQAILIRQLGWCLQRHR